jgi:hypothetical protein
VSSEVAALSRTDGHMEIFYVGPDGSVQDRFWYDDGQGWRGLELAPPGSASVSSGSLR